MMAVLTAAVSRFLFAAFSTEVNATRCLKAVVGPENENCKKVFLSTRTEGRGNRLLRQNLSRAALCVWTNPVSFY